MIAQILSTFNVMASSCQQHFPILEIMLLSIRN